MTRPPLTQRVAPALLLLWSALLPLQTRWIVHAGERNGSPWEYGTFSVYATDALLLLAFTLLAWRNRHECWKRPRHLPPSVVTAVCAFLAVSLLTALAALDIGVALAATLRLALGALAWWLVLTSRVRIGALAAAVVIVAALQAVFAVVQFAAQTVPASSAFGLAFHEPGTAGASVVETGAGRFLRAYGLLPHPNMTAGSFLFAGLLGVGLLLREQRPRIRAALLVALALLQTGLALTFSRAAILVWLLSLLIIVACVLLRERRPDEHAWLGSLGFRRSSPRIGHTAMQITALGILLFGTLLLVFRPIAQTRAAALGPLEARSLQERISQVATAQEIVRDHWLLGTGIGNYTTALLQRAPSSAPAITQQPVHLTLLLMLAELGVLGWLLFLWLVVLVAQLSWHDHARRWRRHVPHGVPWIAVTTLALLALFAVSFFEHYFWSLEYGVMLSWLAFALWGKGLTEA